jgi:type I restriction enzyme S subunit
VISGKTATFSLPRNWTWTKIGDIADVVTGTTPSKKNPVNYGKFIPFVKPPELTDSLITEAEDSLSEEGTKNARIVPPNSVLVSCIGNLGKTGINKVPVAFNQQINAVIFPSTIMPKFGFYYCQTSMVKEWLNTVASATTISIVNKSKFENMPFPLAPFGEQVRIVERVEELFGRLDAGVESLRKVKAQLKRYRQTVLKYAFEGKMTEEWREIHKHEIEPATKLLEQIKQQETERKYKELPPVEASDLPNLPETWIWIRLGEISERIQYGTSEKASAEPSSIPVLRMGNVQEGKIVFGDLKYFPENWSQLNEFLLDDGDVLFNRTNSAELVGKTAVYREHHPKAVFASYLIRVQTNKTAYISEILSFFINSLYGRKYIASVVSQQVGQANVNGTKLSLMPIPFIPYQEQIALQQEIERCFSIADETEKAAEQSLKQAEILHQSILKIVFEGKLVLQDSSDEPAERLLQRIKEERAKSKGEKDTNKKNKPRQLELSTYVE